MLLLSAATILRSIAWSVIQGDDAVILAFQRDTAQRLLVPLPFYRRGNNGFVRALSRQPAQQPRIADLLGRKDLQTKEILVHRHVEQRTFIGQSENSCLTHLFQRRLARGFGQPVLIGDLLDLLDGLSRVGGLLAHPYGSE